MGCGALKRQTSQDVKTDTQTNKNIHRKQARYSKIDARLQIHKCEDVILENVEIITEKIDQQSTQFANKIFANHFLFKQLKTQERQKILKYIIQVKAEKGSYIFKIGDKASCFFIIQQGKIQIQLNQLQNKILNQGDCFGELALMYAAQRSASAICISNQNKFLIIKSAIFQKFMRQISMEHAKQQKKLLENVRIFSYLTNKQKQAISNYMVKSIFKKGEIIFRQKQPANCFYIIEHGSININIPGKDNIILHAGSSFGESSFYDNAKRLGSAISNQDNTVLVGIGKRDIQHCLGSSLANLIYQNVKKWCLTRNTYFSCFLPKQIDTISDSFQIRKVKIEETLGNKNKHPKFLIICLQGKINDLSVGTIFGAEYLQDINYVLPSDITVTQQGTIALIDYVKLQSVISQIKDLRMLKTERQINLRPSKLNNKDPKNILKINNFVLIKKLGEGQFGQVYLVKDQGLCTVYALKCIDRKIIKQQNIQYLLLSERKILEQVTHQSIVGYVCSFIDNHFIYILMEFINGIDLFDVIRQIGILKKEISIYYMAGLILAVEHLHQLSIVYRDLKPENAVINHQGRIYMIDMGTAKLLSDSSNYRTFTLIGTPNYMAPQIFEAKGYSFQVDIWSLGIIFYQFVCGKLPFGQNVLDPYAIYKEILQKPLKFPRFYQDKDGMQVIKKLLTKDYRQRSANGDLRGIKSMKYFSNIDWQNYEEIKPPYIPKIFRSKVIKYENALGKPFLNQFYRIKKLKIDNNYKIDNWNDDYI